MPDERQLLMRAYREFNARNIDAVLAMMHNDVQWANGMEGGYVHGKEAVRAYWTRQFGILDPHVEPSQIDEVDDGSFRVQVHQVVHDAERQPAFGYSRLSYVPNPRRPHRAHGHFARNPAAVHSLLKKLPILEAIYESASRLEGISGRHYTHLPWTVRQSPKSGLLKEQENASNYANSR